MELRKYLFLVLRGWWIVLVATVDVYVALTWFTSQQTKIYSSSTTLIVSPSPSRINTTGEILNSLNSLDRRSIVMTYATILSSQSVQQKAVEELRLTSDQSRGAKVLAQTVLQANAIEIKVEANDPQVAADMANMVAAQAVVNLKNLYRVYDLTQLDRAEVATRPVSPNLAQNNLGAPIGALLGIAIVLFLNYIHVAIPDLLPAGLSRRLQAINPSLPQPLSDRAALAGVIREELRRQPAGRRSLAIILAQLSSSFDFKQGGSSWAIGTERLRAFFEPVLKQEDVLMSLPELNCLAAVLPGSSRANAENIVEQVRLRIAQSGPEPECWGNFGVASYEPADEYPDAVIKRAEEAVRNSEGNHRTEHLVKTADQKLSPV